VEGNYWYKLAQMDPAARDQILNDLKDLVNYSGQFNPFADITPTKDPALTWDRLTELEKRQVMEVRFGPLGIGHLIRKAREAGLDPETLSWEELHRFRYRPDPSSPTPPPPHNLFQHRPVKLFSEEPSPGDLYIRPLSQQELEQFLKANPDLLPYFQKSIYCPDYYTTSYFRLYGENGRIIVEKVGQFGAGDPEINCLEKRAK